MVRILRLHGRQGEGNRCSTHRAAVTGVHVDASKDRLNYAPSPAAYGTWSDTADYSYNTKAFIEDKQANEYFKEHIEYFLTRENQYTGVEYRNEPTILMWECANELEYNSRDTEDRSLAFWYEDIASYIKSIDSNHLVSTGMHGSMGEVYEPWIRRCAFVEDHQVDEIDVCSFHDYPIHPFRDGVQIRSPELAGRYAEHKTRLAHDEIGKPVYAGEYGIHFVPDADTGYISTIETEESASDVESNRNYPQAYHDQHDDSVLVTRQQDIQGVDLTDRNEYFRNLTEVAADNAMDGVGFWRLLPNTVGENASREESREHRAKHGSLAIYPADTETLAVIQEYYSSVVG
ncbi:cellulase family glycosylhydrolase [Natrinema halophilum]|uniref:cellulase family glycosylhydrolase n=1 Tax=Natrinema halophilum TaxID=1699371 RepID=UPI001F41D8D3|nr:cellulase family glycosylhydrolase [Natrinema halophilum]UHQ96230.1 cellulase family glycosylhydrolase [Natrinema halophilum]